MTDIYKDIRTNAYVRILQKINDTTYMVIRLDTRKRYIIDKNHLLKLTNFK